MHMQGKIVVAGGHGESGVLASCETFDHVTARWKLEGSLIQARRGAAMGSNHGRLFIFGGETEKLECDSVEEYNAKACQWTRICGQVHRRVLFGIASIRDRVYLVGGNSDIPMEYFEPNKRSFCDKARTLPARRSNFAVCSCDVSLAFKESVFKS